MIKRSKFLALFVIIPVVFVAGCFQIRNIPARFESREKFVNYDRVKIEYTDQLNSYSVKGFFRFKMDSLTCFQFWGPFGYEIVKGTFSNGKLQTKTASDINVSKTSIENTLGIVIDNSFLQYLFLGYDSLLINNLNAKNSSVVEVTSFQKDINKTTLSLYHKTNKKDLEIAYFRKDGILRSINIKVKQDFIEISVQIIEISYIDKICNFSF